ncbi:MAG: hypothetical protein H0V95_12875 [Actinobacteria bacterium]|nr:hypothetical protein [Actinomycetota bacterium]
MHPPRAPGTSVRDVAEGADGHRAGGIETALGAGRSRASSRPGRSRSALIIAALAALLAIPLLVALGVMRQPRWYPVLDLAQTELRVRDVASADPPLIGLAGRIAADGHQGSHPGPLSFWALWPFYQLFGASSWALQAAAASLNVVAMAAALWIAYRRGGVALVLGVAAVLAVLAHAYGASTLTQAWNPYLPVLWWIVFLLAVWSVVCDDLPLLPVAVFAGLFCTQTHISYAVLVAGLGGLAVAFLWAHTRRQGVGAPRHVVGWALLAVAVGGVLWLPPVIDQLTNSPGNLSIIVDYFGDPGEAAIGPRRGVELLLLRLNPWRLVETQPAALLHRGEEQLASRWPTTGSLVPGVLVLAGWAATVVVAWRLRHRALLRLHLVLGVALVLGVVTLSRIFGYVWYYLSLWAGGLAALMLLATGWTLCVLVGRRWGGVTSTRAATAGKLALAGIALLFTALFTIDAAYVNAPDPKLTRTLGKVVPPTVDALADGSAPGGGREGRYLVTWADPIAIGSPGYGLLNELERAGFDVGTLEIYGGSVTPHRVMEPGVATAEVHLSIGHDIRTQRAKAGVQQVAYFEPRRPGQRAQYERLRARVIDDLEGAGLSDLVPRVDDNLFVATIDTRVPKPTRGRMVRMFDLGLPTAVFVGPPDTAS